VNVRLSDGWGFVWSVSAIKEGQTTCGNGFCGCKQLSTIRNKLGARCVDAGVKSGAGTKLKESVKERRVMQEDCY